MFTAALWQQVFEVFKMLISSSNKSELLVLPKKRVASEIDN